MPEPVALGFRAHSGWAVVAAVAGSPSNPAVLLRRRIETADGAIRGSRQPYHAAAALAGINEAEALIRQCRHSSAILAERALRALILELSDTGYRAICAGIVLAGGRPLPDLASTLRSHALVHTAEGEFFRDVLIRALEQCGLPVAPIQARAVWETGANVFGATADSLRENIAGLGRLLGPPWREDEKLASMAAWIALNHRFASQSRINADHRQ